jgi:TRAP-type mannitol/chloroaromatic compound transport system substrate-binding protein
MQRRKFIQSTVAGAVAAPAIVKAQQAAKWKMQSMWSSAELTYKAFEDLCTHINKLCAGKLEITPFAAGAVTGVFETLDAVNAGVLQGHASWAGYFSGKDPGSPSSATSCSATSTRGRPRPGTTRRAASTCCARPMPSTTPTRSA